MQKLLSAPLIHRPVSFSDLLPRNDRHIWQKEHAALHLLHTRTQVPAAVVPSPPCTCPDCMTARFFCWFELFHTVFLMNSCLAGVWACVKREAFLWGERSSFPARRHSVIQHIERVLIRNSTWGKIGEKSGLSSSTYTCSALNWNLMTPPVCVWYLSLICWT